MMVWVIFLPLAAAIAAFLLPRHAAALGLTTAAALWIPLAGLVREVLTQGVLHYSIGGWEAPLGIQLRADGLSLFMLIMTAAAGLVISLYAAAYFSGRARAYFWPLWLFLWASLNALFLSGDIFNLYIALELLGLSAVALVALAGTPVALQAAMRYMLVSLLGSLFFLFGVAVLYAAHGTLDLVLLAQAVTAGPVSWAALSVMTAGMVMKTALFPLHFWLPPAHANAPAPVSAALSALVVKASLYLLLRLWFEVFAPVMTAAAQGLAGALGAFAILWGSYQAFRQERLKLLVAYSTVAQLGYIFLLFPLVQSGAGGFTAWAGGLYFALSHACAKTVLFLSAGNLMRAAGHDRIAELAGAMRALPVTMFAFALAGVSIVGLPPSGGFVSKWLLLNAALAGGQWGWVLVMAAGTAMAAAYVMRVLALVFTAPEEASLSGGKPPAPSIKALMEWPVLALSLISIGLGFAAAPFLGWLRAGSPFTGPALSGGLP